MINIDEVIELLENPNAKNIICKEIEFRPIRLAMLIATLANSEYSHGYILLGATKNNNEHNINGLSKSFNVDITIKEALKILSEAPSVEYNNITINGKNVFAIKVKKSITNINIQVDSKISKTVDAFICDLLKCCIKLQSLKLYTNASEDECNDFIAALLESRGYKVKDQTRRGSSATGKSSGEVDIFVENDFGLPLTIIEALILSSVNTTYIDTHLDKIYSYDTVGNVFNICLSYVKTKDFGDFWDNYCKHVRAHTYPVKLISCDFNADDLFPYSDIRFMRTTHERSGKATYLYHICVKIQEK